MKYDVIGFPKAGSVSVQKWLEKQGYDASKSEWPYLWGMDKLKKHLGDSRPVLVTREKHDALWSFYEYFGYKGKIDFFDFLNLRIRNTRFLNHTPLEIYDYDGVIKKLEPLNPLIYKLEELMQEPSFPHENPTMMKSIIPEQYRKTLYSKGFI